MADMLAAAKRPLVLYGGSGWSSDAARQLESFAAKTMCRWLLHSGFKTFVTIIMPAMSAMPVLACLVISKS